MYCFASQELQEDSDHSSLGSMDSHKGSEGSMDKPCANWTSHSTEAWSALAT